MRMISDDHYDETQLRKSCLSCLVTVIVLLQSDTLLSLSKQQRRQSAEWGTMRMMVDAACGVDC